MSYISLSQHALTSLAIAFSLAIILALSIRALVKKRSNNSLSNELAQKDNHAMGVTYAAQLFTSLVVTGFIIKNIQFDTFKQELLWVISILALAFTFIQLGFLIHGRLILNKFNESRAIKEKNVCAAIVESGSLIANGIIVIGLYQWANPTSIIDVIAINIAFICCQLLLTIQSRWHEYVFAKYNQGQTLQKSFVFNNTAIGLRYAGHTIASAMALYAGLKSIEYVHQALVENTLFVLFNCALLLLLQLTLSTILSKVALPRINTETEIDHQDNIGVAAVELAIHIAIGLLIVSLFNV